MKTYREKGDVLDFVAPVGGVTSGVPVVIGGVTVVPAVTAAAGETFAGAVEGCYEGAAETGVAWAAGDVVYWDTGTTKWTKTAGALIKGGIVSEPKASAAAVGVVKLER